MEINSGMPNPRGADPAMSKARVKGESTTLIGNSKMSITCCPYLVEKNLYWVSANCFTLFISFSVPRDMATKVKEKWKVGFG